MMNVETIPHTAKKSTKQDDESFKLKLVQLWLKVEAIESAMEAEAEQAHYFEPDPDWCQQAA